MTGYVERSLAPHVVAAGSAVVVVEGARAVGKTRMVEEQVAPALGTRVESLLDPDTLARATDEPQEWLESLPRPCVIDEAQLLPDLPLHVKAVVDRRGPQLQYVLTGSASIGRKGLGGADPLARRARRLTLHPLTGWEQRGVRANLVDALFDRELNVSHVAEWDEAQLHEVLRRGGLPPYLFSRAATQQRLRSDVLEGTSSILGQRVLPGVAFDANTAAKVLDALLVDPGRCFNATKLQDLVDVDRRTITRYVDIFERLFLTFHLPNLYIQPDKRGVFGAKMHGVDTALAYAALTRNRVDWDQKRDVLGKLLESFVAQQLRAHAAIAAADVECFFWRHSKTQREVDVVLVAGDGRRVGVECKLGKSVRPSDLKGLRALDEALGIERGVVVYGGDTVKRLGDKYWALPVAAFLDPDYWLEVSGESAAGRTLLDVSGGGENMGELNSDGGSTLPPSVRVFVSYVHDDDKHGGLSPTQFVKDIAEEYEFSYGRKVEIFLDRESIRWGEDWRGRLADEINNNTVMVTVVTPRYLRSTACRDEALAFAQAAGATESRQMLLPVLWVDLEPVKGDFVGDQLYDVLIGRQYVDATGVRMLAPESGEYRKLVAETSHRLFDAVEQNDRKEKAPVEEDAGFLELLPEWEEQMGTHFEGALSRVVVAFETIGQRMQEFPDVADADYTVTLKALLRFATQSQGSVKELSDATKEARQVWQRCDALTTSMLAKMAESGDAELLGEMRTTIGDLRDKVRLDGVDEVEVAVRGMSAFSRSLKPLASSVSDATRFLTSIQTSAETWYSFLEDAAGDE